MISPLKKANLCEQASVELQQRRSQTATDRTFPSTPILLGTNVRLHCDLNHSVYA